MRPGRVHVRYVELDAEEEAAERLAESGAAPAATVAGSGNVQVEGGGSTERVGGGSGVDGESGVDENTPHPDDAGEATPELPGYLTLPISAAAQVKVDEEVKNIEAEINDRKGMPAYKGHWRNYNIYHAARYGLSAPSCPFTDLIYLNITQATDFIRHMGANSKSVHQVLPSVHHACRYTPFPPRQLGVWGADLQ